MADKPKDLTIKGRVSYPTFTYAEAVSRNVKSKYPKADVNTIRPSVDLLLAPSAAEKLVEYLLGEFLPYVEGLGKQDAKGGLSAGEVKLLKRALNEADWETEGVLGLIRPVGEKTKELAPEAVLSLKVNGLQKTDFDLKAVVRSADQLANPMDDLIIPDRGTILPLSDTKLDLYPGSNAGATINLWAFVSGKTPGITASTGTIVFLSDNERFGGGGGLDEDAIFADFDED